MFMFLGFECKMVNFVRQDGKRGPHPRLFKWCADYFASGPPKLPLYLQHDGHSRSIIGWEEQTNGRQFLMVSDPGTTKERIRSTRTDADWVQQNFRQSLQFESLHHHEYVLFFLTGRILSPSEQHRAKEFDRLNGVRGNSEVS